MIYLNSFKLILTNLHYAPIVKHILRTKKTNMEVSFFENVKTKGSRIIKIEDFLYDIRIGKHAPLIQQIRGSSEKQLRDELKKKLPGITVSGSFNNSHAAKDLIKHSGLIQIDIDEIENVLSHKVKIIQDPITYACFISPSGTGLKLIIKIDPLKHKESFQSLQKYYKDKYNLEVDPKCKDIGRLMYISYDQDIFINEKSETYKVVELSDNEHTKFTTSSTSTFKVRQDVEKIIEHINKTGIDLTSNYDEWLKIGFAFSSEFLESGRKYYHQISKFSEKYDENICDQQYNACLKSNNEGCSIKTFFHIAKERGIDISKTNGVLKTEEANLTKFEKVERFLEKKYDFRLNIISNDIEIKIKDEKDFIKYNEDDLYRELHHNRIPFSLADLSSLLRSSWVAVHDPFLEYFNSLQEWNEGVDQDFILELCTYIKAKDQPRFDKQFKKMLVRSIACAINPKVFNKHAFILVHKQQSSGKTTFCRWLCPEKLQNYYTENINTIDKDGLTSLSENFMINLDELSSIRKNDLNAYKSFLSRDKIKIRRPYGKHSIVTPRVANFVGSTNNEEFLIDTTGNVRWLCFEISSIDFDYKKKCSIDNLWRQAFALYNSGFKYELTDDELNENELANEKHRMTTSEEDLINELYRPGSLNDHDHFHTTTALLTALQEKAPQVKLNIVSLGRCLASLGFLKHSKTENGANIKGYYVKWNYKNSN